MTRQIDVRDPARQETVLTLLIDRSGSMAAIKTETQEGITKYLREQAEMSGKVFLSLVFFDAHGTQAVDLWRPIWDREIREVLDQIPAFTPRGGTPLREAFGRTVQMVKDEVIPNHPGADVLFVTITDGHDNCPSEWGKQALAAVRKDCEAQGWTFVEIGANQDTWGEAEKTLGATSRLNVMDWQATAQGTRDMYTGLSAATMNYRAGGGGRTGTRSAQAFFEPNTGQTPAPDWQALSDQVTAQSPTPMRPSLGSTTGLVPAADAGDPTSRLPSVAEGS